MLVSVTHIGRFGSDTLVWCGHATAGTLTLAYTGLARPLCSRAVTCHDRTHSNVQRLPHVPVPRQWRRCSPILSGYLSSRLEKGDLLEILGNLYQCALRRDVTENYFFYYQNFCMFFFPELWTPYLKLKIYVNSEKFYMLLQKYHNFFFVWFRLF